MPYCWRNGDWVLPLLATFRTDPSSLPWFHQQLRILLYTLCLGQYRPLQVCHWQAQVQRPKHALVSFLAALPSWYSALYKQ